MNLHADPHGEPARHHELHTYEASAASNTDLDAPLPPIPRKRRMDDGEMDITPMIDMTFLLLIFFILTSKIDTQGSVTLPKAMNASSVVIEQSVILTVSEGGPDGTAFVYKGDSTDTGNEISGSIQEQEEEIASYISSQLTGNKQYVLIKGSKGVHHKEIARVAEAASNVEDVEALYVAVLQGG